jgi:hypothetical protein
LRSHPPDNQAIPARRRRVARSAKSRRFNNLSHRGRAFHALRPSLEGAARVRALVPAGRKSVRSVEWTETSGTLSFRALAQLAHQIFNQV